MASKEGNIQTRIMLALSSAGCTIWRNETAGAWVGRKAYQDGSLVTLQNARFVSFGLCKGSSDLIGIAPDGRFLAIEVKTAQGRTSKAQKDYIRAVRAAGGVAGIATSPEQALNLIGVNNGQTY